MAGPQWNLGGALPSTTTWDALATDGAGHWVGIASGGTSSMVSSNGGVTWSGGGALPSSSTWIALATDGAGHWVAIASGGTATAVSTNNGATWTAGGALPSSTTWQSLVTDKNGNWVAISTGGASAISTNNGTSWSAGGNLPAGTWQALATDRGGNWVAIATGSTASAVSTNNATSWSAGGALPASTTWQAITTDGKGNWVAIASAVTNTATSANAGTTWSAGGAAPSAASWTSVATDTNGTWVAVANGTATMFSTNNGTTWASAGAAPSSHNWVALTSDTHGNWIAIGNADFRSIVSVFGSTNWTITGQVGAAAASVAVVPNTGELMLVSFTRTLATTADTSHSMADTGSGGWTQLGFDHSGQTATSGWWKVATAADHNGGAGITITGSGAGGSGAVNLVAIGCDRALPGTGNAVKGSDLTAHGNASASSIGFSPASGSTQTTKLDELSWACVGGNASLGGLQGGSTFRGSSSLNAQTQSVNQVGLLSCYGSPNQASATAGNNAWSLSLGSLRNIAAVGGTFYYAPASKGSSQIAFGRSFGGFRKLYWGTWV